MLGLIFTYAMTYGGAAVALFNPFAGLLIYVCFAIVSPPSMWYWSVPPGHYARIIAIAMLIGWAFKGFGRWHFGRGRGIVLDFIALWVWAAVLGAISPNHEAAWRFIETLGKVLLAFLVGATLIDSAYKLKQLAWVIMLSLGYVAYEMNLSYYSGFNRVYFSGFAGMDNNSVAIAMVAGVGLAFFLGVSATKWWQRLVAWLAAILMAHTIMFSFSRGGMLALILSVLVSFILLPPKKPKHVLAFAICVLIGIRLAGPQVVDRFMTTFVDPAERDASAQSRLELWRDLWDSILTHPLLGVGPNHWPLVAPQYGWPLGKEGHSLWLQTGAELGLPGLLLLLLFYGLCIVRLWPLARDRIKGDEIDPWLPHVGRMVIAGHIGFMVAAQFVSLEGLELPYYVTLLGVGALKLLTTPVVESVEPRMPVWRPTASVALRSS
ncbi:MAG: hypothetical protein D6704_02190 [Nitrospirae bacterium]|nr:MAG: hypothetical protein D6704_02190 [Nitrospirota bacterium]